MENMDKIKKDIMDVHQIMNENLNLLVDRESLFECRWLINLATTRFSNTMKEDSHKLYMDAKKTRYSLMLRKYAFFIAIFAIIFLFIFYKFYV